MTVYSTLKKLESGQGDRKKKTLKEDRKGLDINRFFFTDWTAGPL